jgi:hypothetical protein
MALWYGAFLFEYVELCVQRSGDEEAVAVAQGARPGPDDDVAIGLQ